MQNKVERKLLDSTHFREALIIFTEMVLDYIKIGSHNEPFWVFSLWKVTERKMFKNEDN